MTQEQKVIRAKVECWNWVRWNSATSGSMASIRQRPVGLDALCFLAPSGAQAPIAAPFGCVKFSDPIQPRLKIETLYGLGCGRWRDRKGRATVFA
jgi:hypothetical protein